MKKLFIIAFILICSLLIACNNNDDKPTYKKRIILNFENPDIYFRNGIGYWHKVNPNYGFTIEPDSIISLCEKIDEKIDNKCLSSPREIIISKISNGTNENDLAILITKDYEIKELQIVDVCNYAIYDPRFVEEINLNACLIKIEPYPYEEDIFKKTLEIMNTNITPHQKNAIDGTYCRSDHVYGEIYCDSEKCVKKEGETCIVFYR